jgi:nicotinate-nucleotide--dimethylbenzimidazole phosphoribosyltransferase
MVANFARGGAAINVLARQVGARVTVVDMGVAEEIAAHPSLIRATIGRGTRNMALGPAMSRDEATRVVATGIRIVEELADSEGLDLLIPGEMGIGNSTAAATVAAAITGIRPVEIAGRGTGLDDARLAHKVAVVERALAMNRPDSQDALDVLAKVGGFEIGGIAGAMIAAAARRVPVLLDGFIATSAALLAITLAPALRPYLIAAHRSQERGHAATLRHLGLSPLLELDFRLGEGTGGAMAIPLVVAAVALLNEMATFEEAGVAGEEVRGVGTE